MSDREVLRLLYFGSGILTIVLAVPLIRRKVPPNGWYGFRTPSTLKDPDIWYAVNARFGAWLLVAGIVEMFAALLLYGGGLSLDSYAWGCLAALMIPVAVGIVDGLRVSRSASRQS